MTETRQIRGCCPLDCQDTCAWVATVEDGRVVRVRGAKDHPYTRGVLCAKVRDFEQRTYAPDRLLHPLKRVGPKGSGAFEPISWDEALDIIADRFSKIIAADGAEALFPFQYLGSMGVVQRQSLMRLFHALGASQLGGSVCGASGEALAEEGHPTGFDPEDLPSAFETPSLKLTRHGTLKIAEHNMMTSLDGVFAAGDIVRGASLVVWAIRDARDAAEHIERYIIAKSAGAEASAVAAE